MLLYALDVVCLDLQKQEEQERGEQKEKEKEQDQEKGTKVWVSQYQFIEWSSIVV